MEMPAHNTLYRARQWSRICGHQRNGEKVPERVFNRLQREINKYGTNANAK